MKLSEITHKDWLATLAVVSAICFGAAGTIIAPLGIIDSSMLYLIGQLLIFAATVLGFGATVKEISKIVNSIKK